MRSSSHTKSHNLQSPQASQSSANARYHKLSEFNNVSDAQLTDADYEFLLDQLLQGIAHGWHQRQIAKFFSRLEERGRQQLWIEWLQRFQSQLTPTSLEYRQEIGTLMIVLGKLTQSTPEVAQLGSIASKIGRNLLFNDRSDFIWEYDGADTIAANSVSSESDNLTIKIDSKNLSQSVTESDSSIEHFDAEKDSAKISEVITFPSATQEEAIAVRTPQIEKHTATTADTKLQIEKHTETTADTTADGSTTEVGFSTLKLIKNWFELGIRQANSGNFDGAIASWDNALRLDPGLPEAWHNRGSALGHLGKYSEAIAAFDRALVIDASNYRAWNGRAHALYLLQQWLDAAKSWQKALEIVPDNYLFWFNRACALERLESFTESLVSYQKALEIKPDFQPARLKYLNLVRENSGTN